MTVYFKVRCPSCQRERSEEFPQYTEQEFRIRWDRWAQGRHVTEAFPELTPRQREAMQTGVCDSCWEKIFMNDQASCDHKFIDSRACLKCGWTPPGGLDGTSTES